MALALATTAPSLVIVGFLIVGLAFAAIVPLAFSVAGDLVPERAASAISVVTTFGYGGYGGFLLGPPLVGGLAELVGLRAALGVIVVVAGLSVFVLCLRLRENQEGDTVLSGSSPSLALRTSEKADKAKFAFLAFSEVGVHHPA
jgi:MFS family permease